MHFLYVFKAIKPMYSGVQFYAEGFFSPILMVLNAAH